jgi:uncharacterized protein (UPF0276 family)
VTAVRALPRTAMGLGLRPSFHAALRAHDVDVDFFEILAENYLGASSVPWANLAPLLPRYRAVVHGVGMNLLGVDPLDDAHLARVGALADRVGAPFITDHLCWSSHGATHLHDLLPVPSCEELVPWAAERIRLAQRALPVPLGVENVSTYLRFSRDDLPEWAFVSRVVEAADCGLLLDLNNVYVSSVNHGFDPLAYLDAVPWERVLYVHLAGHEARPDGLLHDTHDRAVDDAVLGLYAEAWRRGGPFPTLLEWDADVPPLERAVAELHRAKAVRA